MNSLLKTLRNKSQQESENRLMVQWRDYQIKKGQNERFVEMAIDQTILQGSITLTALNINMQDILVRYSNKD